MSFFNLILYGLPKSGKTTVGRLLQEKTHWDFIDTDELIAKDFGKPCRQIFQEEGEFVFRQLEKEKIHSLKGVKNTIISTGGGSLNDPDNVKVLKQMGYLLYLEVDRQVLWDRIKGVVLPAYLDAMNPEKSFFELCQKRLSMYEKAADFILESSYLSLEEVVEKITKQGNFHG